jgi:hypothetical protein
VIIFNSLLSFLRYKKLFLFQTKQTNILLDTMSAEVHHITMTWDSVRARPVYIDRDNKQALTAKTGLAVRVPCSPADMSTMSCLPTANTAPVVHLPVSVVIPPPVVSSWPGGATEEFAAKLGWRYKDTIPSELTVAYIVDIKPIGMSAFHTVIGGAPTAASFPFSTFLGLEGRTAGSATDLLTVTVDPANITFAVNRMVSNWGPINDVFRGSLSHAGVEHNWQTGPGVYVRYRNIFDLNR